METMKQCPYCKEEINPQAIICKYCHTNLSSLTKDMKGRFVKVRLKSREKVYNGDIFIPDYLNRLSNVINDSRHFISLTNTKEETETTEISIGFIAVNKNSIEWVRLLEEETKPEGGEQPSQSVYDG